MFSIVILSMLAATACRVLPQQTTTQAVPLHPAFVAQYIRTDGYHGNKQYPVVTVIRSRTELMDYYETNEDLYNLERRTNPAADSTIGFLDATDKYMDDFFKINLLILVLVQESSGSNRHKVADVVRSNTGLDILVDRLVPEVGTADMAQWHILVELKASDLGQAAIQIYFTQKPADQK
jgi:hypothetical protein